MSLTAEEINLKDSQIRQLPTIQGLKQSEEKIFHELEVLEHGQQSINGRLDRGSERMDGIEDELKDLKGLMFKYSERAEARHTEIKNEIKNKEIQELRGDLALRQKEDDKKSAFKSGLYIGLSVLAVGTIISVLGYLIIKAYG